MLAYIYAFNDKAQLEDPHPSLIPDKLVCYSWLWRDTIDINEKSSSHQSNQITKAAWKTFSYLFEH